MFAFQSHEILIGNLRLGGNQPVRIQSMTNMHTMDTDATVAQVIRLAEAGCEMVRITAANIREAENLKNIRNKLHRKGVKIPLIADIHFLPKAAEIAARIVDKVRINPGNYSGSHHKAKKYSDIRYGLSQRTGRNGAKSGTTAEHLQTSRHRHPDRNQPRIALRPYFVPIRKYGQRNDGLSHGVYPDMPRQ